MDYGNSNTRTGRYLPLLSILLVIMIGISLGLPGRELVGRADGKGLEEKTEVDCSGFEFDRVVTGEIVEVGVDMTPTGEPDVVSCRVTLAKEQCGTRAFSISPYSLSRNGLNSPKRELLVSSAEELCLAAEAALLVRQEVQVELEDTRSPFVREHTNDPEVVLRLSLERP